MSSYSWQKDENSPQRLGIIFQITLKNSHSAIVLNEELQDYGWFTLEEALKLDTIGSDSSTGTIGQLQKSII